MPDYLFRPMLFVAAIASGLVAGVFFAFSSFVMAALGRLAPAQGIAAMNSINVTAINPLFMLALFGTGVLCIALAAGAFGSLGETSGKQVFSACALYVLGCIGVTIACNVPLNDALAAAPGDVELWSRYLREWAWWNHVRAGAALGAAVLFTIRLMHG